MLPVLAADDYKDGARHNAILGGELGLSDAASRIPGPNLDDLIHNWAGNLPCSPSIKRTDCVAVSTNDFALCDFVKDTSHAASAHLTEIDGFVGARKVVEVQRGGMRFETTICATEFHLDPLDEFDTANSATRPVLLAFDAGVVTPSAQASPGSMPVMAMFADLPKVIGRFVEQGYACHVRLLTRGEPRRECFRTARHRFAPRKRGGFTCPNYTKSPGFPGVLA
jgi:hypothetical protein